MSETPGKYVTRKKDPTFDDILECIEADVQLLKQNMIDTSDLFAITARIKENCERLNATHIPEF